MKDKPIYPRILFANQQISHLDSGMTLREHYAGLAMQGILSQGVDVYQDSYVVKYAVKMADVLITELNKEL